LYCAGSHWAFLLWKSAAKALALKGSPVANSVNSRQSNVFAGSIIFVFDKTSGVFPADVLNFGGVLLVKHLTRKGVVHLRGKELA
jgi:hypothetical protein